MRTSPIDRVIEHLRRAVLLPDGAALGDGDLLDSFIERHDETALAALVRRHGPMVWGVCRRLLSHHDAEDAFQATFIVLVRKAATIRSREMVGNWLYGVAHQTALLARRTAARRRAKEVQVTEMPDIEAVQQDQWAELRPLLDEELSRLPEIYRAVIVLCDLEGRSRKETACQLGVPEGTVAGRLARARVLLAKRLTQRGVSLSGGALAAILAHNVASARVPASVVSNTIRAASLSAAGHAVSGGIPVKVAALTQGVMKAMLVSKLKSATVVLLVVALACGAAGMICRTQAGGPREAGKPAEQKAEADNGKKAKTDVERLQGKWQIMSIAFEDKIIKREDELDAWKGTFDKDLFVEGDRVGQVGYSNAKIKLDATRDPKQITIQGDDGLQTFRGIYVLNGDTVKICMNGDGNDVRRPEEFVTKKGTPLILISLKRHSAEK